MRKLSLATRTFVISLLPLCLTMTFTFFGLSMALRDKTREGLRDYVHTSELLLEKVNESDARRTAQAASLLTENAGLKASLGLLRETGESSELRSQVERTIEEQLRELHKRIGYEFLAISDSQDRTVLALELRGAILTRVTSIPAISAASTLLDLNGVLYQIESAPITLNDQPAGRLAVGKKFDLTLLDAIGDMALMRGGKLLRCTLTQPSRSDIEQKLSPKCMANRNGCEVKLNGDAYLVFPLQTASLGADYKLLMLYSLDAAVRNFLSGFAGPFTVIGIAGALFGPGPGPVSLLGRIQTDPGPGSPIEAKRSHRSASRQSGSRLLHARDQPPCRSSKPGRGISPASLRGVNVCQGSSRGR